LRTNSPNAIDNRSRYPKHNTHSDSVTFYSNTFTISRITKMFTSTHLSIGVAALFLMLLHFTTATPTPIIDGESVLIVFGTHLHPYHQKLAPVKATPVSGVVHVQARSAP
jgi:hypothetical protein